MAIDTADKRASAAMIQGITITRFPNVIDSAEERADIGWGYGGVLAGVPDVQILGFKPVIRPRKR